MALLEAILRWPPFKLERFFAKHEFNVEYVLCASDCESMTVKSLLALEPGAADRFQDLWLGYTESTGSPGLREEISRIYDSIDPDGILVHTGAEEAIFLLMHAVLEPGDNVVVQWPCYQSLAEVARGLGCSVTLWQGRWDHGWSFDPDALEDLVQANTRVVIINSPHNPTGAHLSRAVLDRVVALVESRGCLLLSDEVYRESEYAAVDRLPAACDVSDRAVSLGVMSKSYGLAGLRIGWVATHAEGVVARMAQLKDYTTICNSAPSEYLATVALRNRGCLVARTGELIRHNLVLLDDFFARHGDLFAWHRPAAGPIAFPRLVGRAADGGATAFCERLARDACVLLLPGDVYDVPNHVRVGFGRRNLPEALARLEPFL